MTTDTINTTTYFEKLKDKINSKTAIVGTLGMGYVGLPNMVSKARKGFHVIGFDPDNKKVKSVLRGENYIGDVDSSEFRLLVSEGKISATSDFAYLKNVDVILICVPTPIDRHKNPDLSFVDSAANEVANYAKAGSLIILESTTYPSTTEDYIVSKLEEKGFVVGEDIFVAYSPERIDPMNKVYNVDNTPRVVGGHTRKCSILTEAFIGGNVKTVTSTKVAEMAKVFENTFRFVNIALANELAVVCDKLNIDAWEAIDAAATKPYGFMPFYPSAGIGGHCIPVDPFYLSWYAKQYNISAKMIEVSSDVNDYMNEFTVNKIIDILNRRKKSINGSRIAILGAAYKPDIDDVRSSAIYRLYSSLESLQAEIDVIDPHISSFEIQGKEVPVLDINYETMEDYDLVVILTNHSSFNYNQIASKAMAILDTKNSFKSVNNDFVGEYYKL